MTGAGDSARARAAGYAGAQIGRQNLDQRMGAAAALAGPSAQTTLAGAANPFLGTTQTSTGTQNFSNLLSGTNISNGFSNLLGSQSTAGSNTQNTNASQTGASATTGFSNMASAQSENQAGTATGSSAQAASGQIPQSQTVQSGGGGGCIVCSVGLHHGVFRTPRLLRLVVRHKLQREPARFRRAAAGYFLLYSPFVRKLLLPSRRLTRFAMSIAKSVVYEEARIAGRRLPFKSLPWALHWTWHWSCWVVGAVTGAKPEVTDGAILKVLRKENVLFQFGGAK